MTKIVENKTLDEERALYGSNNLVVKNVRFDGPADGESALKECSNIQVVGCYCNLRYPFWHNEGLKISDTEMTALCRAALWYSHNVQIDNCKMHGIKALRECGNIVMRQCDVISPEFGWSVDNIEMNDTHVQGEYFMLRSSNLHFNNVTLEGKYSFQYVQNATLENCRFDTKDAFWHAKNMVIRNCVVKGEYLGWYSDGLTFENCMIIGTQPLCYCTNLKLKNCQMIDADLCFEKSFVEATLTTPVLSIKNLLGGTVCAPSVGEIICDDPNAHGKIIVTR